MVHREPRAGRLVVDRGAGTRSPSRRRSLDSSTSLSSRAASARSAARAANAALSRSATMSRRSPSSTPPRRGAPRAPLPRDAFFAGEVISPPARFIQSSPPRRARWPSRSSSSSRLRENAAPPGHAQAADGAAGRRAPSRTARSRTPRPPPTRSHERQLVAQVRPVGPVLSPSPPRNGQPRERPLRGDPGRGERLDEERLDRVEDVLLRREGHLEVDLRELELAVGAQVLVAKAAGDLEVLLEARHHQDLLEELGRLRQRVELAAVHARRARGSRARPRASSA